MSKGSTLYRFQIALSDVDRSVYESIDFRIAMHASETEEYLLTRVLAYALNYEDGIQLSNGLADPDMPSIYLSADHGAIGKWIDIGNPTARRLHKAAKTARVVRVYTYKDPENLKREMASEGVHRASEIEIFSFDASLLRELGKTLARDNVWTLMHNEGELMIQIGESSFTATMGTHRLG